jgi:hypothetical protein
VFNIGTREEVSVIELARRIKSLTGSSSAIETVEYEAVYGSRFEDMQRRVPALDKIKALVGYEPAVTLDQLLRHDRRRRRGQRARSAAGCAWWPTAGAKPGTRLPLGIAAFRPGRLGPVS